MSKTPFPDSSSLTFPCDFTLKVFGLGSEEFETAVLSIVHKHAPNFSDRAIESRLSKEGNYCALSITIHATSKEQLDNIYKELSSSPNVMMVL
jgi:putative lipoic acid-binding regulatory protein